MSRQPDVLAAFANAREAFAAGERVPRHRHRAGYAAIALAGRYEEAGSRGRHSLAPGLAMLHAPFDAHADRFGERGGEVLNVPLPPAPGFATTRLVAVDPDALMQAHHRRDTDALLALLAQAAEAPRSIRDWPDRLAADLVARPDLELRAWARTAGLCAETLSRGFRQVFDLTPQAFRREVRLQRAVQSLVHGREPLAQVAQASGFADQAHMSRDVMRATAQTPRRLRDSA